MRDAVGALPPKQRAAVVCRFYLAMTVAETAETLGCAEGTVKSATHQALASLIGWRLAPRDLAGLERCPPRGAAIVPVAEITIAFDARESFPVPGRVRGPAQLEPWLSTLPTGWIISAGIVDGRNVWRNDITRSAARLRFGPPAISRPPSGLR